MINALQQIEKQNAEFAQKLQAMNLSWVKNREALERYLITLWLLWKHRIQLTPDRLADEVLHEHLSRSSFETDMKSLFGQTLIHELGATEAALTRSLFEQEFGAVTQWESADCNIVIVGA